MSASVGSHVSSGTFQTKGSQSYEAALGADRDWRGVEMRAEDVRMFLPLIVQFDLATEEEIGIDTLAERLREETVRQGGAARLPVVVSAWARTTS